MTVTANAASARSAPPAAQGGRPPDHRPDPLDRQHRAARHAAPGHPAQPARPRPDRLASTSGPRCEQPERHRRVQRRRRRRHPGQPAVRVAGDRGHRAPGPAAAGRRHGAPPRRGRRGRRRPRPGQRRSTRWTAIEVELRAAAARARHGGARWPRAPTWCTRTRAPTSRTPGSSTRPQAGTGTDVDDADAEVVIERRYVQQRLIPAFMEPRSVIVDPGGGEYTIWSATQIPHILRVFYALLTGMPEHKIRVIAPDVGGGFGGKLQVTPEEMIAFFAAQRVGQAGQVHRDPRRLDAVGAPRAGPDPGHHAHGDAATAR